MQFGLTWPLQRLLKKAVPYGELVEKGFCWDLHCITLNGRSSLLLVHCATRYTCVRYDMTPFDWADLEQLAIDMIKCGLADAGIPTELCERYLNAAGEPIFTRTHGRREVAFLNRAWEDVLAADMLLERSEGFQSALSSAVNRVTCRCAGYSEHSCAQDFLHRWFEENNF